MKNHKKEFGKYSLAQLQQLVSGIEHIQGLTSSIKKDLQTRPPHVLQEKLADNFYWHHFCEIPYITLTTHLFEVASLSNKVSEAVSSEDPQQYVIDMIINSDGSEIPSFKDDKEKQTYIFTLAITLSKNIDSLIDYGIYLEKLVSQARLGDDDALFKVIRIDRSLLSYPGFQRRFALAELSDDEKFFKGLKNTLSQKLGRYKELPELRYLLAILNEDGTLDSISEERQTTLFCDELKIYPSYDVDKDTKRNLARFVQRWKKDHAT